MRSKLKIGTKAVSTFADNGDRLLWTIPKDTTDMKAQILIDIDHFVSGDLCHFYGNPREVVWEYSGKGDICESLEISPRFSLIVPMVVKDPQGNKHIKNVRFPKSVIKQFENIAQNTKGEIKGLIVSVSRSEDSKGWTRYEVISEKRRVTKSFESFDQDDWLDELLEIIHESPSDELTQSLEENGASIESLSFSEEISSEEF